MSDNNTIYNDMVQPRGPGYRSDNVKPWSHYREPIDNNDGRLHGESRRWGDASPETQSRVIDSLIGASRNAGLSSRETAYVLAIARVESGFNPDAAAGTTSASGLGQFVDRTGAHYGVNNANRFDVDTQSRALVQHYIDNRDLAQRRGQGDDHIYKYHHDGPSKDYGGLAISRREVTPYLDRYQQFVEQHQSRTQGQGQVQGQGQGQAQEQGRAQQHTAAPTPQPHGTSHSNFQQTMERMLPSQGKVDPHITGHYGEQRARGPHGGTDFNYEGGQTGINRQHPTVHAPISGTVTFSGGQYGTVKIRDAQGNSHEILHLDSRSVKEGDVVRAGDAIGTMGGRGPNGASQYAQHVHYQMHDANGKAVSPETWWNRGQQVDASARDQAQRGNGTLRQGDHGPEVRELQQHLNRLGIRDAQGRPLAEDGRFGDNTHEAVTALQKQRGLTQDGIVGRDTRAGLAAAEQAQARPAKSPQLGEPGHPDTPLYDRMRTEADRGAEKANPPHAKLSNEAVANLTLQAKQAGIDSPDKLKEVTVANDKAFVAGTTPGFRAVVDLQQPAPALEQTSAQLARQSAQQQESVQREQQQDANKAMARG